MEYNQPLDKDFSESFTITSDIRTFLAEIAKWANFIAIVGFVFMALLVVLGLFMGTIMSSLMGTGEMPGLGMSAGMYGGMMSVIYIIMALIYFFPILYLYRFAKNTKAALRSDNQEALTVAFANLKSHYKFIGILMAIILGFYALIFVLAIVGGLFAAF